MIVSACLTFALILQAAEKAGPEVLVVGDVLHDVPVAVRPEPGKPVYYLLLGNVESDLGFPMGGMPRPDPKAMEAELVKVLASQGFIRTKVGGPMPQVTLAFSWGTANLATEDTPGTDPLTGENEDPNVPPVIAYNQREMRRLVGLDKFNWQKLSLVDGDRIIEAFRSDRVYIFLVAFDTQSLTRGKKVVLWRTRMSVDALDHSLPDSFATMLASAAPYFGRSTEHPVLVDDRNRQPSVTLGEMEVLGEVPTGDLRRRPDESAREK